MLKYVSCSFPWVSAYPSKRGDFCRKRELCYLFPVKRSMETKRWLRLSTSFRFTIKYCLGILVHWWADPSLWHIPSCSQFANIWLVVLKMAVHISHRVGTRQDPTIANQSTAFWLQRFPPHYQAAHRALGGRLTKKSGALILNKKSAVKLLCVRNKFVWFTFLVSFVNLDGSQAKIIKAVFMNGV